MVEPNTDRVVPRRRALLLAGVGLGSLGLAACGGNSSSNETSEKDNSSSSSASETPQDSNSTTPSASGEASNTPDPSFSKGYSGGEKAPEGKYVMADYRGPAQNVRVPARPDESYKVNSLEGLKKSVFAWVEWSNYGIQTGDFDVARQFVSNEFTEEIERYDYYTKLYQEGGWIIDGLKVFEFHGDDPVMKEEDAKKKELAGDIKASWGDQMRSYVLHPYQMVKDLRTGYEEGNTANVLDGGLNAFIDAGIRWRASSRSAGKD